VSTDALQIVAGRLPLDMEMELGVVCKRLKEGEISEEEMEMSKEVILDKWQIRWNRSDKER